MEDTHTCTHNGVTYIVSDLWAAVEGQESVRVDVDQFKKDWAWGNIRTMSEFVAHMERVGDADMSYPIIISDTGFVMDGMHRIAKAIMRGDRYIQAVYYSINQVG